MGRIIKALKPSPPTLQTLRRAHEEFEQCPRCLQMILDSYRIELDNLAAVYCGHCGVAKDKCNC